jgi:O-antigen/teichoic acid export membrane protein
MTRLTRNVIYNTAGQGAILVLSLIAVRFIFRRLGDDAFGIIVFNLVLTTVLSSALELGISATVVREVSSHFEADRSYVNELLRTASLIYWGFGALLFVLIWVTAPLLVSHWVNLRSMDTGTATTMLRILSVTSLVTLPKVLYTSLFRGRQLMELNNAIDVGTAIAQQGGTLVLLLAGAGLYAVAAWISISAALGIAAYVLVAARIAGWGALRPAFSTDVVRRNVGFTGHMMVISGLSLVQSQAPQVIVSKLLPIVQFGYYGFIASTVSRATLAANAVAQAAFPSFSKLHVANDRPGLLSQYVKLQDLVCFGTLPLFAGICFAAQPVYGYVFDPAVAQQLLLPTALLALGTWMNATLSIPYMLSIAVGRTAIPMNTSIGGVILILPITVFLVYRFGIAGAGLSWVCYHVFAYAYMVPRVCRQCLDLSPFAWYRHVAKAVLAGAATYGLVWVLAAHWPPSLPAAVLAYAAGSLLFLGAGAALVGPDLKFTIRRMALRGARTS